MIISFRHKFIFVAIPKTASHSIRNALRPHLANNDWEQCVLFEEKFFPVRPLAKIGHGHITCQEVEPFILPDMWKNFFKFAVVRDPFKRFFSYCHFFNHNNQLMKTDPLGAMKNIFEDNKLHPRILLRPQYKFITDEEENIMVDYVGRLENLQKDFDNVCERIKLPQTDLRKTNTSDSSTSPVVCDQELKEMILDFYQKDFELFGYSTIIEKNTE